MNDKTLKPCPFCGGAGQIEFGRDGQTCVIRCENWSSGCMGSSKRCDTHEQAIAAWNTRIQPATSEADYEEVLADHRRLVRELDVALNGEDGAAEQASLSDIVNQVKNKNWPHVLSAASSGDKVYRATLRINDVTTDMVAGSEAGAVPVEDLMTKIQEFASTWAIVDSRFDDGTAMERAEASKAEIRAILEAAPPSAPAAESTNPIGLTTVRFLDGGAVQMDYSDYKKLVGPDTATADAQCCEIHPEIQAVLSMLDVPVVARIASHTGELLKSGQEPPKFESAIALVREADHRRACEKIIATLSSTTGTADAQAIPPEFEGIKTAPAQLSGNSGELDAQGDERGVYVHDHGEPVYLDGAQTQYTIYRGRPSPSGDAVAYVYERQDAEVIRAALSRQPSAPASANAKDAERYRWLCDTLLRAVGGGVEVNDAKLVYEEPEPGQQVRVYWYPDTPVGFYEAHGVDLNSAIDAALAAAKPVIRNSLIAESSGNSGELESVTQLRKSVEELPRYGYGYKADEWGEGRYLAAIKQDEGIWLKRDDVLATIDAARTQRATAQGKQ